MPENLSAEATDYNVDTAAISVRATLLHGRNI